MAFSAAVTVTGTPQLALVIGTDTTPRANYASGSGTQTLQFDYEVAAGDEDTDGIAFPINALALNGGTITASGTAAVLDHGRMSFTGLLVDGSRPAVRVLVSNSAQAADDSANTSGNKHAQLFHTGGNTGGYTFTQRVRQLRGPTRTTTSTSRSARRIPPQTSFPPPPPSTARP